MIIPILRKHLSCVRSHRISYTRLFSTTAIIDLLLHKYGFSPELASKVASSVSARVQKDPERADSTLSFLRDSGFSNAQLERVVSGYPGYLSASLENTIKPKIRAFQDLGFCSGYVAEIVSITPTLFRVNLNAKIIPSLSVLKSLLGSDDAVVKLLNRSTRLLRSNVDRTMVPNIEFLKSCGIPLERIVKFAFRHGRSLLFEPENFRKLVRKAEVMGVHRTSNMFIYALGVSCELSDKTLKVKLQVFQSLGYTESDVMNMFQKAPQVFSVSADKLKIVTDIILATGKYDMSCIVNNPTSLSCSTEQRYKPRFQILEILEGKNLIKNWPSLARLYQMSDEKFFKKFVGPYLSEVGEVYAAKWCAKLHTRENKLYALT